MAPAGTVGVGDGVPVDFVDVAGLVRVENVEEGLAVVVGCAEVVVVAAAVVVVASVDELDEDEDKDVVVVVDVVVSADALYAAVAPTTLAEPETELSSEHCPLTYVMAMQE